MTLQAVQGRRFGAAALRCVARVAKAAPDWGVIFFGYDWFAAYSAAAAANVAWDILIPHYKALLPPGTLVHLADTRQLLVVAHAVLIRGRKGETCRNITPVPDTASG